MKGCCKGPGWASPLEAFNTAERERLLYVVCTVKGAGSAAHDYLATIDVDPDSPTYSQVVGRSRAGSAEDELHHTGWNACSSCYTDAGESRRFLVCPSITTGAVNIFDVQADPRQPPLYKRVPGDVLLAQGRSFPHTVHCLDSKCVMISTMGDANGDNKGGFVLLDNKTFEFVGHWGDAELPFGYDFWYQPRQDFMVSSEWGSPNAFKGGFNPLHIEQGKYGTSLHVFKWSTKEKVQTLDLGAEGVMPLEVRFFHEPSETRGFVGCAASGNVFLIDRDQEGVWHAEKVIDLAPVPVSGWMLPELPSLITDLLISMDDRYLYVSDWSKGQLLQYDVTEPRVPRLTGKVCIGGVLAANPEVKVLHESSPPPAPPLVLHEKQVPGGPQMIQLSLDGRRLYVTTSLFAAWDRQIYPRLAQSGGDVVLVDVDREAGGLAVNRAFHVDLSREPDGPAAAHEVRYPGGDCTSDIWL